jgi:acyl-coenzyme A thioesterase 9
VDALVARGALLKRLPSLLGREALSVEKTQLSNTFICQPQDRNTAGRVFGGFLMRRAFELGP